MARERHNGSNGQSRTSRKPPQSNASYFDKQPPFDAAAEIGVVGSAVLLPEVLDDVVQIITPEDFYDDAHGRLFRHLVAMHEENRRFDTTLLIDRLRRAEEYDLIGGAAYIAKVIEAVPNAAHARWYAEIVREKALKRKLILASTETLRASYDELDTANELIAQAETSIARISDSTIGNRDTAQMSDVVHASLAALEERLGGNRRRGLSVGLTCFNDVMGLVPGGLVVLAGRPSQGKSAAAMRLAANVAQDGLAVYVATLEMTATELADRMLSAIARVPFYDMANGRLTADQRGAIVDAASRCSNWRIAFDDSPSLSVSQIGAGCRRFRRRQQRLDLIIIDYAQLVEPENKKEDRAEQLSNICKGFKRLAREMRCTVILLAQVNRDTEKNADLRPRLSNLKGSGGFEEHADSVVFVHRPKWYLKERPPRGQGEDAEIIVAKNRNGPVNEFPVLFFPDYMDWRNKASADEERQTSF